MRTADGNIISSGLGSGLTSYSYSNVAFMGSLITVGSSGQVWVSSASSASVKVKSLQGMRAVSGYSGKVYIAGTGQSRQIGAGSVNLKVIRTSYSSSGKVRISSVKVSGGSGGAGGASGGSVGADGASGGSGSASVGSGGSVTGATVLGGAASMGANGAIKRYGSGITEWTIQGATTNNNAQDVEVIGDFGGE